MRRHVVLLALLALLLVAGGVAALVGGTRTDVGSVESREAAAARDPKEPAPVPDRRTTTDRAGPEAESPAGASEADEPDGDLAEATYEGVVTRADTGAPVEGVAVEVRVITEGFGCLTYEWTSLTDAEGRWSCRFTSGRARVYVQGDGWVSKGLVEAWDGAKSGAVARRVRRGSTERFDVIVEPAARISGRVVDAGGTAVANASVGAWHSTSGSLLGVGELPAPVQTDEAGRFEFGSLVPGETYFVRAWTDTCASAELREASAGSGETADIEVRLAAPRSIEVIVLDDATGTPVAGATVAADSARSGFARKAATDGGGRALLSGLPPGEIELSVSAPEHLPLPDPLEVGAEDGVSGAIPRHEIRLRRAADARIVVLADDGHPLAECSVTVTPPDSFSHSFRGETGEDGAVRIPHLDPSGTYRVEVYPYPTERNVVSRTFEDWTPKDDVVRLERGLTIEGVVVDVAGRPLGGADVSARAEDGSGSGSAESDAAGRFRIERLRPGAYVVSSEAPNHTHRVPLREVRAAAGTRDLRVVQDPGGVVAVRFSEGRPPDVWAEDVTLAEVAGGDSVSLWGRGDSPVWRAAGLVVGARYRVRRTDGERGLWAAAEFVAGETAEVTLTLAPGRPIAGRVAVPQDDLRADFVHARFDGLEIEVPIDADGRFRFSGLAPGQWELSTWAEIDGEAREIVTSAEAGREDVVLGAR